MPFQLQTPFQPSGDQPQAITKLVSGLNNSVNRQTLLGVTGSGKTFTVANVIQQIQQPTLVISHNKTLAGQLYQEFKDLFPNNKVSYFVSYYDYYQPEAYLPSSDTYIAKEVEINDLIDKLRLEATSNLFSGNDNIVIASVSCIYNIGDPLEFGQKTIKFSPGQTWLRRQLFESLVSLFYQRNELEFKRGSFRVRGDMVEIWPSYQDWIIVLEFSESLLQSITSRHPFSGIQTKSSDFILYPAKQFVGSSGKDFQPIFKRIRQDCQKQIELFRSQNKILEAHRLEQRVEYDLEMLQEVGYINGIENYSIYFENSRQPGDPPFTLIDYFHHLYGDNFLTVIDESHVTVPQIRGMYFGDLARKKTLVDYGFRLPSAYDNRPLTFSEFNSKVKNILYASATPADYEITDSKRSYLSVFPDAPSGSTPWIIEQIIRPTGLVDPPILIRPETNQIPDLISEIASRIRQKERTLVVTITKKMAEELSAYLSDPAKTPVPFKVTYLHADIDTLERSNILDKLRAGDFDVLVGINLLREGLDLPEVSLVAILDAGSQGFLRSRSSLIQIMGRASRHLSGQVILYSDQVSDSMRQAIQEVNRRRTIQLKYNQDHGITPQSITKAIRPKIIESIASQSPDVVTQSNLETDPLSLTPPQRKKLVTTLRQKMRQSASDLNFEQAIRFRDKIKEIENT
ncbi:MAG: excinuclease ABC subunit UvrB [Candidatus Shapirobacteria bacterium]